jgi:dihydroorotate dehydrogenase electron transfer subunit
MTSMTSPLHPTWPCDRAVQLTAPILEHETLARDTKRLRIACPPIARQITPGQFVMVRLSGFSDPLLGRALALYDTVALGGGEAEAIDVVYLVKGKFTSRLAEFLPGQRVDVWGPLGNGFAPLACEELIMVAGGIGQTPFVAVAKEYLGLGVYGSRNAGARADRRVTLCYGARSKEYLAGVPDFERLGVRVLISTDDGSHGHRGYVTDLLPPLLEGERRARQIVCCGPEPMMHAAAQIAAEKNAPCQASLEAPMACGIGVCFTCVARVFDDAGGWDYKRTCVEGPVFDAQRIAWDARE